MDCVNRQTCTFRLTGLLLCVCLSSCIPGSLGGTALGQTQKLAKDPVLVMRSNRFNSRAFVEYVQQMNRELGVGGSMAKMMNGQDVEKSLSSLTTPMTGQMVFMVQGLIPGVESITFAEVVDEKEFERLIRASAGQMGATAVLEGADGLYKQTISSTWKQDITDLPPSPTVGAAEGEAASGQTTQSVSVGVSSSSGISVTAGPAAGRIIEENGRRYREHQFTVVQYLRYHDGFMYASQYEDLHTMELPSGDSLRGAARPGMDAELEFFPDRIPVGFKHLFWNTIQTTGGAGLQQRDEEDPVDYGVRRSAGDLGLDTIHTLLFDTELVSGNMLLAADDRPLSGTLKLQARANSHFSKSLDDMAFGRSRLAGVLRDDAGFTFHASVRMPEGAQKLTTALGEWIRDQLVNSDILDADRAIAGDDLKKTMDGLASHRNLEVLLKVGWTPATAGVIYGGIQVDENPHLLTALFNVITGEGVPEDVASRVSLISRGDLKLIQILLPPNPDDIPLRLSHLYVAHSGSCLWVAAGTENAVQMLQQCVDRSVAAGIAARAPVLTLEVDLDRWLSWPQDDPTGIAQLPQHFDQVLSSAIASMAPPRDTDGAPANTQESLLKRVASMGGPLNGSLTLEADASGLMVHGRMGAAMIRYWLARWLNMVDGFMGSMSPATIAEPGPGPDTKPLPE